MNSTHNLSCSLNDVVLFFYFFSCFFIHTVCFTDKCNKFSIWSKDFPTLGTVGLKKNTSVLSEIRKLPTSLQKTFVQPHYMMYFFQSTIALCHAENVRLEQTNPSERSEKAPSGWDFGSRWVNVDPAWVQCDLHMFNESDRWQFRHLSQFTATRRTVNTHIDTLLWLVHARMCDALVANNISH